MFRKLLTLLGFLPSEEDRKMVEQWKYAQEHYGAKIIDYGYGRWRLTLDSKKVRSTPGFKEVQRKAELIVKGYNE